MAINGLNTIERLANQGFFKIFEILWKIGIFVIETIKKIEILIPACPTAGIQSFKKNVSI